MLSAVAGAGMWAATGHPLALPVTVAAGFLVDADHAPDMWWSLALVRQPTAVYALHAWEWLAGMLALGIWIGFQWWLASAIAGYALHLVTDHVVNRGRPLTYSLIYRACHRFRMAEVAPSWTIEHAHEVLESEIPLANRLVNWWKRRASRQNGK
ncbi:MAG: hypothetical protein FJ316_06935 [SAR202 cluster bacterium]|nr:hypothetical protein [SAR202 cluster bacterium]